jgi:small subunit ribosomal protein S18e
LSTCTVALKVELHPRYVWPLLVLCAELIQSSGTILLHPPRLSRPPALLTLILLAEVQYALTAIPGVGRRISNIVCKKAGINFNKRAGNATHAHAAAAETTTFVRCVNPHGCAGEMSAEEIERVVAILHNPASFKIPDWMLNRQKDRVDGKSFQLVSNVIATKLREDLEALKKVRAHRGLRHYWCIKVRGQHTCTTGRGRSYVLAAASDKK